MIQISKKAALAAFFYSGILRAMNAIFFIDSISLRNGKPDQE